VEGAINVIRSARSVAVALATLVMCCATGPRLAAQATRASVTEPDPTAAITALRNELIDSCNKGDLPRLLSHLDDDVVVTWQNGEVCRGPAAVKAYYDKMMTGPNKIVAAIHADPKVIGRHVYGDWAVSWGEMNDHFTLTDGRDLPLNSRFTSTIARRGDAWKVTSFHVSVNAFDNPILGYAARKGATWAGVIAGVVGLLVGVLAGWVLARRRRKAA
jgi:ketosteroid isomerase-like protein